MTHSAIHPSARTYDQLCREARSRINEIAASALATEIERSRDFPNEERPIVIDVREPDEFAAARIPGASSLPRGLVEKHIVDVARIDQPLIVYCQTGKRSALVADTLQAMGYANVRSLAGGIEGWMADSLPTERSGRASAASAVPSPVDPNDWSSVRADFGITGRMVRCADGLEKSLVYLDHAASTHPPSTVVAAYAHFLEREYANVHRATYALAREATDRFDKAFGTCAQFVRGNLETGCVVFTSNTTHGCDLVAHVVAHLPGKVMVTDLEHHSNDLPFRKRGDVVRARVTREGRLDLDHVAELFRRERIKLLTVCGATNVTGWMPPIRQLARMAHEHGAMFAVDGAQLVAHVPIDVRADDDAESIDFLITAGHKAYAPFGIGFVYGKRHLLDASPPHVPGGGTAVAVTDSSAEYMLSPDRHQGGTPNIAGAIAYAEMLRYLSAIGMPRVREHELELMRRAWPALKEMGGVTLYGPDALEERVGIITFNVEGVNDMLAAAVLGEEYGVAVRNGRFCAHVHAANLLRNQGGHTPLGDAPPSAVRASFGLYNNLGDVERLLDGVRALRERRWKGEYQMKAGGLVNDQSKQGWAGGRCADAWMEGRG
ncbi:MAG: aminotransferase class V-fold PLP-dependent enzyme [Phycisphaerae bacterium]|nr:aminotransferase class V-fold PLP-dependent enzyme [Phycisphaerae bacterium]